MRKHILTYSILFSINSLMVSCQSKTQSKETNTPVNLVKMKEQFPNQKTAYEKTNDKVAFYKPSGQKILTIDLKRSMYSVYSPEFYHEGLIKINDMLYFLPLKVEKHETFSIGETGTASGTFKTINSVNDKGLLWKGKVEYPVGNTVKINDISYEYNKFGQLLKVEQNNQVIVDNSYDDNGHLVASKMPDAHIKYSYDKEGNIVTEEVERKGNKKIYTLAYNSSQQIIKKYTQNQDQVKEFKYDANGRVLSITEYSGEIDKSDSHKLNNHFSKKIFSYTDGQLANEKHLEFKITNASVLVNKKWEAIDIEQQRKLAWEKINDPSEIPVSETDKKYSYQADEIKISINDFGFSNRVKNGKSSLEKEVLSTESIKFTLDGSGRIIKKESLDKNKKNLVENYSY